MFITCQLDRIQTLCPSRIAHAGMTRVSPGIPWSVVVSVTHSVPLYRVLVRNFRTAMRQKRYQEAEAILERAQLEQACSPETRILELELLLARGALEQAEAKAQVCLTLSPDCPQSWFLAGKVAYRQRHYAQAREAFEESLRLKDSDHTALWLGKTLTQTRDFVQARAWLQRAIRTQTYAFQDLAWLHLVEERFEEALKTYEQALKFQPDSDFIRQKIVQIKARLQSPQDFLEEAQGSEEVGEKVPEHLLKRYLESLIVTGDLDQVRRILKERVDTLQNATRKELAWLFWNHKLPDMALEMFLDTLEGHLSYPPHLNALESCARKTRNVERVIERYRALAPQHRFLFGRIKRLRTEQSKHKRNP